MRYPFLILFFTVALCATLAAGEAPADAKLPTLLDLGSVHCIPCKQMAPILEALEKDFAGRLYVKFIDVNVEPDAGVKWSIEMIPTQIFLDATGKELFRHVGVYTREEILAKWKALGVDLGAATTAVEPLKRLEAVAKDARPAAQVCHLCDHDIVPASRVVINAPAGAVPLCSVHCWSIWYSCYKDAAALPAMTTVTDAAGTTLPLERAWFLYGVDERGRPVISAFATREAATAAAATKPGMVLDWKQMLDKELATRCGFCDRAVYPQDAAAVTVGGLRTYGCCAHCAMGVAARLHQDITVDYPDNQTGTNIHIVTKDLAVAAVEPATAVAWFGKRKQADGTWASAGCFHQGFFATADNLKAWLAAHPFETGEQITIQRSLDDKLRLTAEQVQKACKIGECKPR